MKRLPGQGLFAVERGKIMSDTVMEVRSWRRVAAAVAILSILLSACVTGQEEDPASLTASEKDLRAKAEEQRKTESAMTGAIVGAVALGILGAVLGARGGNLGAGLAMGALAGAAIGGMAGVAYGSYANAKARKYANAEARATEVSKGADETLAYYNQVNASAQTMLSEQQMKVAQLNEQYRAKAITKEQFQKGMASSNRNETIIKDQIAGIDKQINEMKTDEQSQALARQIQQLEQQRDGLKQTYDKLLQLYGTVPAEVRVPSQA